MRVHLIVSLIVTLSVTIYTIETRLLFKKYSLLDYNKFRVAEHHDRVRRSVSNKIEISFNSHGR
jgi:hypothetical protein